MLFLVHGFPSNPPNAYWWSLPPSSKTQALGGTQVGNPSDKKLKTRIFKIIVQHRFTLIVGFLILIAKKRQPEIPE